MKGQITVGQLRNRATIQARVKATTALGEASAQWQDVDTVWCNVTPVSGREPWQSNQVQEDATHQVDMRYQSSLSGKSRLVVGGVVYQVQSAVNPDGRKRFTRALCVVVTEGNP